MKTVSVVVACYNEEGNVAALYEEIGKIFKVRINGKKE